MKHIYRLWLVIFGIIVVWIYFLFISPKIFNSQIIIIPNVIDLSEEETIKTLTDNHVKFKIAYLENSEEKTLRTIPYPGTNIKADNVITVYIGKIMPDKYRSYLGSKYDDVAEDINIMCDKNGIKLKLEFEEIDNVMEGIIIKESLTDGVLLEQESELCLTISVNNNYFLMPNLVGLSIAEALMVINEYNLKVNLIYYQTPIDPDIVIFQSTQPNTIINKNTTYAVDIYVSKGLSVGTVVDVNRFIETIENLGYQLEINYIKSNAIQNKLVAFEVQKLYDINVVKYIIWITE